MEQIQKYWKKGKNQKVLQLNSFRIVQQKRPTEEKKNSERKTDNLSKKKEIISNRKEKGSQAEYEERRQTGENLKNTERVTILKVQMAYKSQ